MDYLEFIKQDAEPETLALRTADFLQQQLRCKNFVLMKHTPSLNPFTVLVNDIDTFDFKQWKTSIHNRKIIPLPGQPVFDREWYYIFPEANYETDTFFFFFFSQKPDTRVQDILTQWSRCTYLLTESNRLVSVKNLTEQGSLIAQLLHDIQAIITLQSQELLTPEAAGRIEYQQRVNKNLLFFIRPLELMSFKIPVELLIKSSLQIAEIQEELFSLTISPDIADITTDAELFSKAFNEIILNAVQAGDNKLEKISISVQLVPQASPFIAHNWLQITITDQGNGISNDYLEHIWEPFFTTRKAAGHSGFGLTNAKKIILALNGYIHLSSVKGQGTEVKIYLPMI